MQKANEFQHMLIHSKRSKRIARFTKESILNAQHEGIVAPDAISRLEYFCNRDSSFHVLSDEATVVGVQLTDKKVVSKEHTVDKSCAVVTFSAGKSTFCTLAVHQQVNVLLAGGSENSSGCVNQYRLDTGDMIHNYGNLGIGAVVSSARLGNLCFFGGYKSSSFVVIDALTQQVVQRPVATAVGSISSLAVCTAYTNTPNAKAVLAVAGTGTNYSANRNDLFDVTQLVYRYGSFQFMAELSVSIYQRQKELTQKVHTLEQRLRKLQDRSQIQSTAKASLEARISSLEQQLQKQAHAHTEMIQTKEQELRRLTADNQALRDSLCSLKQTFQKNAIKDEGQVLQKVILGLFHHSPTGIDEEANANLDPIPVQAPGVGIDIVDVERLQAQLAAVQRRNRRLTALNQNLQVQIVDLRAQVQTLSALRGEWWDFFMLCTVFYFLEFVFVECGFIS